MLNKKPKRQTPALDTADWWILKMEISADAMTRLHLSAIENGRSVLEEITCRLERDLEREALGPRRSVRIRRKKYHGDRAKGF
jgi:hypothetical protein